MNKSKNSKKKLSKVNLLEKALAAQSDTRLDKLSKWNHELTEKMKLNEHSTDALRYMTQSGTLDKPATRMSEALKYYEGRERSYKSMDFGSGRDWTVVREYSRQSGKTAEQNAMIDKLERGRPITPHPETLNVVIDNPTVVSIHHESINKIEALAVNNGRAQVVHERTQKEIQSLKSECCDLQREIALLKTTIQNKESDIKRKDGNIDNLLVIVKKRDEVIEYLKPKAKSKSYYIRRVDSRNILKKLRGE